MTIIYIYSGAYTSHNGIKLPEIKLSACPLNEVTFGTCRKFPYIEVPLFLELICSFCLELAVLVSERLH